MELFPLGIIYFLWIGGINEADAALILITVSPKQLQQFPGTDPDITGVNEVRIWLAMLTFAKRQRDCRKQEVLCRLGKPSWKWMKSAISLKG